MQLVTVADRGIQHAWRESGRIDHQHIPFPAADGMTRSTDRQFINRRASRIILFMARGWESKSVEDQIQEREAAAATAARPKATPEELQLQVKREGLQMARTRTLSSLQNACDARYRAQLELALADLDAQLLALEPRR